MRIDRMGIRRDDSDTRTDNELYGSMYMVKQRHNNVNDYGGLSTDRSKLDNITNAAAGSTYRCDDTGDILVKQISGEWIVFGGE